MSDSRVKQVVIVGGGSSGWMAAATMARFLKNNYANIRLIESDEIGIVGVGEATIPSIVNFLNYLGIDEQDFMRACQATFKLAIKFKDWRKLGESFYHPFGSVGVNIDNHDFFSCWLKAAHHKECNQPNTNSYTDFSPAAAMAEAGKFYLPHKANKDSFLAGASYAYHFDAGLVAKYFSKYALDRGVIKLSDKVVNVQTDGRDYVSALKLASGKAVEGDFFLDCTGFHSLLIEKTLGGEYEDWSDVLPCDRAIALQTEKTAECLPYTTSTAVDAGWIWNIPLQQRVGNGYVYSSRHCSDEAALATLKAKVQGEITTEPRVIPFVTGRRKKAWDKNCVAIGLSAGFLEPLESTAIHLVMRGVRAFLDLFPDKDFDIALENEYNRMMSKEYETIRDFIVLHYCTSERDDSPFWRDCKNMAIPESLQRKINLYRTQGLLEFAPEELFKSPSWHSVFQGMGVIPKGYPAWVESVDKEQLSGVLQQVKELMKNMAEGLPTHDQFLQQYCRALRK